MESVNKQALSLFIIRHGHPLGPNLIVTSAISPFSAYAMNFGSRMLSTSSKDHGQIRRWRKYIQELIISIGAPPYC
jgi:uncharacterized protein (DUF608 family)